VRTRELIYMTRLGQAVWQELRGLEAGYSVPQYSIHRGKLLGVLHEAVLRRCGPARVHVGHRLLGFDQSGGKVTACFQRRERGQTVYAR
jgi:5-methylphenazine-1-carboxylate 1-monooxygenase